MSKAVTGLCMGCMIPLAGQQVCPHCGYDSMAGFDPDYIKPGTLLAARYIVGRLAHKNGEGAQYIGYDSVDRNPVWIQEYFPRTIARRDGASGVVLPQQNFEAQYKALMSDFVDICNEVKRLSITEPVIPIENVLYENNTIYAVYSDLHVTPLEAWLAREGGSISAERAMQMFLPLLNSLSNVHAHGQIHRGISPYTIYVDAHDRLYLWNFALSGTRTANSELEAELFSGYSAPEQYSANGWQGTWTDVYAVAALLYRVLSGIVPPKSTLVGAVRPLVPLQDLVAGLPLHISDAVSAAMHTNAEQRTQVIATFTSQLVKSGGTSTAVYDTSRVLRAVKKNTRKPAPRQGDRRARVRKERAPREKRPGGGGSARYVVLALGLTVLVLIGCGIVFMTAYYPDLMGTDSSSSPQASQSSVSGGDADTEPAESSQTADDKTVPLFVGRKVGDFLDDEAYKERFEFSVTEEYDDTYEAGVVFEQSPKEGTLMPEKGVVILHVSKGPKVFKMPDLTGKTLEQATDILYNLDPDLKFEVFERYDSTALPGSILRTVPEKDTEVNPKQESVYLFVVPERPVSSSSSESSGSGSESDDDLSSSSRPFFFYD